MVKRRNHEVPKGLLKNWLGHQGSKDGLHYVDLKDGSLHFEEGKGANFAITDYIYVPERKNGERDDWLENWFSTDENGLAVFAQHAAHGSLSSFNNEKMIVQAIRACIALGSRSAYGMFLAMSFLQAQTEAVHEAAVANVLRSIGQKFREFSTWDFVVLYDLPISLIVNERPFMDFTFRGFDMVSMALGPRSLLMGTPSAKAGRKEMSIGVGRAAAEHQRIVNMHNHAAIEMARQWIVAGTRSELEAIEAELTPEKVLKRRQTDRVIASVVRS